jgi:hypothetical protein
MKAGRIAVALGAAAANALPGGPALAATSHGTTPAISQAATPASNSASRSMSVKNTTVMKSCLNRSQVRPSYYMIACGDGSLYLSKLHWSAWASTAATATGKLVANQCVPSCANGKWDTSDVLVVLWAAAKTHSGGRQFMRMTVIYTGKRPAHTAQTFTVSLWYPVIR